MNLYMSIFLKENPSLPAKIFLNETLCVKLPENLRFFPLELNFHCFLLLQTGRRLVFFGIVFSFNVETKLEQRISQSISILHTSLLYTLPQKCLKSFDFIISLYSHYRIIIQSFLTRPRQINFQARKNLFDVLILCESVVCEKR